jgi:type IV pilus assembly protein PilB
MCGKTPADRRMGQLLVCEGLIDERQLERALSLQTREATYRPLGEILGELGFVSRRHFHDILLKYRKQIPLGELLVKMGVISDVQLAEALGAQEKSRKKLGQILVEKRSVTRAGIVTALCTQLGISGMDPVAGQVDQQLLNKVTASFLRRKKVLPLFYDNGEKVLKVLMEDPADGDVIADLEKVFKMDIEPVMLRNGTIDYLLDDLLDVWQAAG